MIPTSISTGNAELPQKESTKDGKTITLSSNSLLNQHIVNSLNELFEFIPPKTLKQYVMNVFLHLLTHDPSTPGSFKDIAEAYLLLFQFLDLADNEIAAEENLQQRQS